eukprot:gene10434-2957_t
MQDDNESKNDLSDINEEMNEKSIYFMTSTQNIKNLVDLLQQSCCKCQEPLECFLKDMEGAIYTLHFHLLTTKMMDGSNLIDSYIFFAYIHFKHATFSHSTFSNYANHMSVLVQNYVNTQTEMIVDLVNQEQRKGLKDSDISFDTQWANLQKHGKRATKASTTVIVKFNEKCPIIACSKQNSGIENQIKGWLGFEDYKKQKHKIILEEHESKALSEFLGRLVVELKEQFLGLGDKKSKFIPTCCTGMLKTQNSYITALNEVTYADEDSL